MSFLSRRQRASQQNRVSAQSYASEPAASSRWGRFFRRRDRSSVATEVPDAPLSLLTLSSHHSHRNRPPELRRVPKRRSLHSLRAILQATREGTTADYHRSEPSPRQLVRQDYSAYHAQTPLGLGHPPKVQPKVWNSNGPLPTLRHRGHLTRVHMTSNDEWEAQAHVDDALVNTTPKRRTESVELRRRTAQALDPAPTHSLFGPVHDPYSEAVADWNIGHHGQDFEEQVRASLDTDRRLQKHPETGRRHSLSHKPEVSNLRDSSQEGRAAGSTSNEMGFFKRSHDKERKLKSSSGDKPLPAVPNGESSHKPHVAKQQISEPRDLRPDATPEVAVAKNEEVSRPHDSGIHSELGRERGYLVRDAEHPPDLTGIVDLTNTEDTDVTLTYAPAVTHETRYVESQEIVQEQITREIHNHYVYHRVLPVLDFEVLPARHFVHAQDGSLTEISEDQIPGGPMAQDIQRTIADAISKMIPKAQTEVGRRFTARKFEGTEGDYKEWIGEDGIKRTEQWWVHPPTWETHAQFREGARSFHFNSEQDGFRDPVLDGRPGSLLPLHESGQSKPATKRFPPPRGASLGKTGVVVPASASTTTLPVRPARNDGGDAVESSGVGVAF